MARTKRFDPFALRSDIRSGKKKDYDDRQARKSGLTPVASGPNKGHMGSLNPKTGTVLKGRGHDTFWKTRATEEHLDSDIKYNKKRGRYQAVPRKKRMADTLKPKNATKKRLQQKDRK